jgi:hypothetical protein
MIWTGAALRSWALRLPESKPLILSRSPNVGLVNCRRFWGMAANGALATSAVSYAIDCLAHQWPPFGDITANDAYAPSADLASTTTQPKGSTLYGPPTTTFLMCPGRTFVTAAKVGRCREGTRDRGIAGDQPDTT